VLEAQLMGALLDAPALVRHAAGVELAELLTNEELRAIFQSIARMMEQRGQIDFAALRSECAGRSVASWLEQRLAVPLFDEDSAQRALVDGVPLLSRQVRERQLSQLGSRILDAKRAGDEQLARELMQERVALFRRASPSRRDGAQTENHGDLVDEDA